jgi:hypothetical protein
MKISLPDGSNHNVTTAEQVTYFDDQFINQLNWSKTIPSEDLDTWGDARLKLDTLTLEWNLQLPDYKILGAAKVMHHFSAMEGWISSQAVLTSEFLLLFWKRRFKNKAVLLFHDDFTEYSSKKPFLARIHFNNPILLEKPQSQDLGRSIIFLQGEFDKNGHSNRRLWTLWSLYKKRLNDFPDID